MTRYAAEVKADEDALITENFDSIEAFLIILSKRICEKYYWSNDAKERDDLRKEMNAVDIVHRKLGNICCERKETGD